MEKPAFTTSNLIGIPVAVLISTMLGIAWWAFQQGGDYRQLRSDIEEQKRRMSSFEASEQRGRLWERLAEHGKDIGDIKVSLARLDERSQCSK